MKFSLVALALYIGVGAIFHALIIGPRFDWGSAWAFAYLLAWPVMVVIHAAALALGV